MEQIDFLGVNVLIGGGILLVIALYLVFLIRKRRTGRFLHDKSDQKQ
ncbi:MAG: hypothetical protein HY707_10465 [Ignavibacteriae bacterium]|nr:hypothetical protein [Ignavibacteriota bacterium]